MPTITGRGHVDDPWLSRVADAHPELSDNDAELRFCAHRWCAREPAVRGVCWAHYAQLTGRSMGRFRHAVRQPAMTGTELVDEVAWLLGTDSPTAIAHRLGFAQTLTLARRLRRHGSADLARHFETSTGLPV